MSKAAQGKTITLLRIPKPPRSYVDYMAYLYGIRGHDELDIAVRAYYKKFPDDKSENCHYRSQLLRIAYENIMRAVCIWDPMDVNFSGEGITPLERIEVTGLDNLKHGRLIWMVVYDFEFWKQGGEVKARKLYIPLKEIIETSEWGPAYSFYNQVAKTKTESPMRDTVYRSMNLLKDSVVGDDVEGRSPKAPDII